MKCKFCGAELDETRTVCPACQKDISETEETPVAAETAEVTETAEATEAAEVTEAAEIAEATQAAAMPEAPKKKTPIFAVVACGLAACAIVALILFGPKLISQIKAGFNRNATETSSDGGSLTDPNSDGGSLTDRSVYTVQDITSAEDARLQQMIASCGDTVLTNGDIQILYRIQYQNFMYYAPYYAMYGMEAPVDTLPLSEQVRTEDGLTWEQYFLSEALNHGHELAAAQEEGHKNGFVLDEETQKSIDSIAEDLETEAVAAGYDSALSYIQESYGKSVSVESFVQFYSLYTYANAYEQSVYSDMTVSEEQVNAFYDGNPDVMTANGIAKETATVRHILISPADADGDETSTDEEWAEAKAEADRVYALYMENPTEDYFVELAGEYTTDPGSKENGGLYEDVTPGRMVTEFNDWIFDKARKTSDCEIVKTVYGYHIIYFISSDENADWYAACEELCKNELMAQEVRQMVERNPMKVWYNAIVLDDVQRKPEVTPEPEASTEATVQTETAG